MKIFEENSISVSFDLWLILSEMFSETLVESLTLAICDFQDLDGVKTKKADTHNICEVFPVPFCAERVWLEV